MNAVSRIREYLRGHGAAYTLRRCSQIIRQRYLGSYDRRRAREMTPDAELEEQRKNPPDAGLISILVPVYNTDPRMLKELTESIRSQTYENFEAILYDGAGTRADTRAVLDGLSDPRLRVIHAEENKGISGNTNEALKYARGEYAALCDHDDVLAPDALWRAAEAICREHPDVIYSDEDRIMENSLHHMDPHYKPDWSPETLLEDNYICHLAVIRKELLESIGGLRSGFDGSQDHDLFLRLGEKTDRICHIPRVLYSWREVKSSRSHRSLESCLEAGCRAAEEHEAREGRTAYAVPVNKSIRLWTEIDPETTIEALIHGETEEDCRDCLAELEDGSPWRKMTAALIVTDDENRFRALNEAAESSEADVLLVIEAGVWGMNRHFLREMLGIAMREGVAGVSPVITDRKGKITHGGFALGTEGTAACIYEDLPAGAGGLYDAMNKIRNVGAISPACMMVRKDAWVPFDPGYRTGLAGADLGMAQMKAGRRFAVTPHATAIREKNPMLLSGRERYAPDEVRFREKWGTAVRDPYYSGHFNREKADYGF